MDFSELATSRYSVRDFSPKPVEGCQPSDRHLSYRDESKWIKEL